MLVTVTALNRKSAKEVMLRKCQTSSSSSVGNFSCSKQEPLLLAANLIKCFWNLTPDFFLFGAFFELANGQELLHFFDDIFKFKSTIDKRRTTRPARQLYQTQTFGNGKYAAICHTVFNGSISSDGPLTAIN